MFIKKNDIPNFLTVVRLLIIPVLVLSFYIPGKMANVTAALLFTLASLTDFFDGYLARLFKVQSDFGKCLDPIADKIIVGVAIIMLIHFGDRNLLLTISGMIIISREILVSGLREYLATINVSVPVSKLAKYKTASQMVAITLLLLGEKGSEYALTEIFGSGQDISYYVASMLSTLGEVLLCTSAIITIITGYIYWKVGKTNFK